MSLANDLRGWAKRIKRDGVTLWFACKHRDTPVAVKTLAVLVVAYALSPIDLIPDFIPVLGYVDDVMLLPGLIWLTIRMLPSAVLSECRSHASGWLERQGKPRIKLGIALVVAVWCLMIYGTWQWFS